LFPPVVRFGDRHCVWIVVVRTQETIAEQASAAERYSRSGTLGEQPVTLVCAGLLLALVVLAIRIASVW
jgi:uncharacterized membrane protein